MIHQPEPRCPNCGTPGVIRETRTICIKCNSYVPLGWGHTCDGDVAKTWSKADPTNYTQRSLR